MKWSAPATWQVPLSFLPCSCMTHTDRSLLTSGSAYALSRGLHTRGRERGVDVLSSPCLSSSRLRSCCLVIHAQPSSLSFLLSLPRPSLWLEFALFSASFILSAYALSSTHLSLRLSFSLREHAADLPAWRKNTFAPPASTAHPHGHAIFSFFGLTPK